MRRYECIFILDPALEETAVSEKAKQFSGIITTRKGEVHSMDHWGKRRLAYEIDKRQEGIYTLLKFSGDKEILAELSRIFRFDDKVLRHLIVLDTSREKSSAEKSQERSTVEG